MKSAVASKRRTRERATAPRSGDRTLVGRLTSFPTLLSGAGVVALAWLCYANSLGNGFVFDDSHHLLNQPRLRSLSNIKQLLWSSYRPMRDVSYALDWAVWANQPFGFHLTNTIIHSANGLLVLVLMRRLTGSVVSALIAACVFVVHPLHTDAVAYISGRRDVLFTLFYLGAILLYLAHHAYRGRAGKTLRNRLAALLLFAAFLISWGLSLLSKEMAASLPFYIFTLSFCLAWPTEGRWFTRLRAAAFAALKKDRWFYLLMSAVVPAFAYYSVVIKGGSARAVYGFNYWGGSPYTNALTVLRVHAWYLKQLVFPTPVVQYAGAFDVSSSILGWREITSITVVGGMIGLGVFMLYRNRLAAFAILSFFVLLLPVSHIIPHHELLADHYLYLPMTSFGLVVALAVRALAARGELTRRIAYGTLAVALAVLAVMTVARNRVWKDALTLWQTNYREVPRSPRAMVGLANEYISLNPVRAGELYEEAISIDPYYSDAYVHLVQLYKGKERLSHLEELLRRALELPDPDARNPMIMYPQLFRSDVNTALGLVESYKGNNAEAERLLWEAIEYFPLNPKPYAALTNHYKKVDPNREIDVLKLQVRTMAFQLEPFQLLAHRLKEARRYDEAIDYLKQILQVVPDDFYSHYHLADIYRGKRNCETARAYMQTATSAAATPADRAALRELTGIFERECRRR